MLASTARAERAKGSVLQFVGVDAADPPADAVPFITQSGITYPVGQDSTLRVTAGVYGLNDHGTSAIVLTVLRLQSIGFLKVLQSLSR